MALEGSGPDLKFPGRQSDKEKYERLLNWLEGLFETEEVYYEKLKAKRTIEWLT